MAGAKSKPVVSATEGETKQVDPKGSLKTERAGAATASPSKLDAKKKKQEQSKIQEVDDVKE